LISSGIYGYPREAALETATRAIEDWLKENEMDVSIVLFP
jgi:O-acetyl-ADP-ribose deacetylase (regulator of RNase III)